MSDSDRVAIQIGKEGENGSTGFGSAPTSAYESTRFTSESLTGETSSTTSAALRSDRNVEDVVRTSITGSCELSQEMDLNFRQSDGTLSITAELMAAAVCGFVHKMPFSDITRKVGDGNGPLINDFGGGNTTGTNGDGNGPNFALNKYEEDANGTTVPVHGLSRVANGSSDDFDSNIQYGAIQLHQWFRFHPISTSSVVHKSQPYVVGGNFFRTRLDKDVVNFLEGGAQPCWELEGSEIVSSVNMGTTASTDHIVMEGATYGFQNGQTDTSFTIEKAFLDVDSGEGERGTGMSVDTWSISANKDSILTQTYSFQGKRVQHIASSSFFTVTYSGGGTATITKSGNTVTVADSAGATTNLDVTNASYDTIAELSAAINGITSFSTENLTSTVHGSGQIEDFSSHTLSGGNPKTLVRDRKLTSSGQLAGSTRQILNAIDHVGGVYVTSHRDASGNLRTIPMLRPFRGVVGLELSVSNALSPRNVLGELGTKSYHRSAISVTGTLQVYYNDATRYQVEDIYEGFEDTGIAIAFEEKPTNSTLVTATSGLGSTTDDTNHAMVIDMPRVKITGITRHATGTGSDVIADINFQAFYQKQDAIYTAYDDIQDIDETLRVLMWCPTITGAANY